MRIKQISDLHTEFREPPFIENDETDVLILGGDICIADHIHRNPTDDKPGVIRKDDHIHHARRYRRLFEQVSSEFNHVIYVMGNHEFYHGDWNTAVDVMREELVKYPNIHLLEKDKVVIDDIVFLGASLWTDMNNEDPLTMINIHREMNDFKYISNGVINKWDRLRSNHVVERFKLTLQWLTLILSEDSRKTVVVSHHPPSRQSITERFRHALIQNGAFTSNLDQFIADHPQIALWTFGHVHHAHRYYIENTLCVANPYGYPGETTGFNSNRIIDLNNMPDKAIVDNDYGWNVK